MAKNALILKAIFFPKTTGSDQSEATALDGVKMLHESTGTSQPRSRLMPCDTAPYSFTNTAKVQKRKNYSNAVIS